MPKLQNGYSPPKPSTARGYREAVTQLRFLGFALCKPDPEKKSPTYSGWPTFSLEPGDFADGDQVGIMGGPLSNGGKPGHALVIVDLDVLLALELADDHLPPTAMMEGRASKPRSHRYYLVPCDTIPQWAISTAEQGAPAAMQATGHAGPWLKRFRHRETGKGVLDFIGTGGQVVAPPSLWTSMDRTRTERREWEGGAPGEPAVVPFLSLWRAVCDLASECDATIPDVPTPDTK